MPSETEESQERQVIPWVVYGLQIKEAHFGEGITYVPSQAFRDCGFLESVSLPVTATSFSVSGADAPNLADIYFAGTQAQWNALYSYISGGIDPEIHCSDSVPQTFTVTSRKQNRNERSTLRRIADAYADKLRVCGLVHGENGRNANYQRHRRHADGESDALRPVVFRG